MSGGDLAHRDGRSDGFGRLIWSEWTKFRTVRAWRIGLAAVVVATVLFSYLTANGSHSGFCASSSSGKVRCFVGHPPVPTGPSGEGVADEYFFVHRALTGDGTITAELTSLKGDNVVRGLNPGGPGRPGESTRQLLAPWAKAGVIVASSTTPGAPYAAAMATGSHGVRFQYDYTHDVAGLAGKLSTTAPRWLRVARRGATVTAYDSTNGRKWTEIGSATLPRFQRTVDIGLFATSPITYTHRNQFATTLATGTFDRVTTTGASPGRWRSTAVGGSTYYPSAGPQGSTRSGDSFRITGSGDIAPALSGGPTGGFAPEIDIFTLLLSLLILIVLAASFITTEYRRGLIRTTLVATPQRWRVLAAKAVVVGVISFLASIVAAAIAVPISVHVLRSNGNYVFPVSAMTEVRLVVGTAALVAVVAVGVLGLGALFRRSAGPLIGGIVLLVLPVVLGAALSGSAAAWLYRVTPAAGFAVEQAIPSYWQVNYNYSPRNGYFPLPPWAGLAVICLYSALALVLGALALERRDA